MASESEGRGGTLKSLAHDLGNLAYRLTFLSANLQTQIPDPAQRDEAGALLRDTDAKLRRTIETLRRMENDG